MEDVNAGIVIHAVAKRNRSVIVKSVSVKRNRSVIVKSVSIKRNRNAIVNMKDTSKKRVRKVLFFLLVYIPF
ncbi:hypothetical protein bcgnr5390_03190 [Bacillus luti]